MNTPTIVDDNGEPLPHVYCVRCYGAVIAGSFETLQHALDQHVGARRCAERMDRGQYTAANFAPYLPWGARTTADDSFDLFLRFIARAGARVIEGRPPVEAADLADPMLWAFEGPGARSTPGVVSRAVWVRRDVLDAWRALAPHHRNNAGQLVPLRLQGQEYVWAAHVPERIEAYSARLGLDPELLKRVAFLTAAGGGEAGLAWLEAL